MTRYMALSLVASGLLAACECFAGEATDVLEGEILTAKERAARELQARRSARPVLVCEPSELALRARQGETAQAELTVKNGGGRTLSWEQKSAPAWLRTSKRRGELGFEEEEEIVLTAVTKDLPAGIAQGRIVITARDAAGSPLTVPVALRVLPGAKAVARPPEDVRPEPGRPRDAGTFEPGARELSGFGVRLGYVAPGGGDVEDFSGGVTYGLYYRPGSAESRLGFEFGLDLGSSDSEPTEAESSLVMVSAAALLRMNGGKSFYVLGGGRIVREKVEDGASGADDSALGGTLDLGAGTVLAQGRVDVRATYSILLGSENVPGAANLVVGYSF